MRTDAASVVPSRLKSKLVAPEKITALPFRSQTALDSPAVGSSRRKTSSVPSTVRVPDSLEDWPYPERMAVYLPEGCTVRVKAAPN